VQGVDPDHPGATITLKDIEAARSSRRRQLRTQINERVAVVADHLPDLAARPPSPLEKAQRSGLRTCYEDRP
jgi:putative transposase